MEALSIDQLTARIGSEIGVSDWFEIDQARISAFGDITEDPQFIHMDPARAAAETPFGGTIAHGFLTLSLLSAMGLQVFPKIAGKKMTINYGMDKLRFLQPVPSGGKIRGRFTLTSLVERKKGQFLCAYTSVVEIKGIKTPALIAEQLALYMMSDDG